MLSLPRTARNASSSGATRARTATTLVWSLLVIGLGWGAGRGWLARPADAPSSGEAPQSSGAQPALTTYFCPMHPSYHAEREGDCPVCNMKMTPLEAGAEAALASVAGHATLRLSPARAQLIGVRTARVESRACTRALRAPARVVVDENGLSAVSLKTGGWVEELFVRTEGALVEPGQPLFTLYSPELFEAQRKYILASALLAQNVAAGGEELDAAKRQRVETSRARLALWDMSDEQIAALERAGAEPMRTTPILARERGVVLARNIVKGSQVEPGEMLFELADLARVWVVAEVHESELAQVVPGAAAEIELPSVPGRRLTGTVDYVYPTLDEGTRTARVRIVLANQDGALRPGMYATVSIALDLGQQIVVDDEAVLDTGLQQLVFVELAPGEFEPRSIVVGARFDGQAVVQSGLEEGERIVTSGTFLIDSESRLKAALSASRGRVVPAQ